MPNNHLGSQSQPLPQPRDFDPETDEFSITRTVDGHGVYALPEDNGDDEPVYTRANRHTPGSSTEDY